MDILHVNFLALFCLAMVMFFLLCPSSQASESMPAPASHNAHQFTFVGIDNTPMLLEDFKGKAILIVNVASQCGLVDQYNGLQNLYETYKDQGLVVIGVPSNDFGGQEPGSEEEIQDFATKKYGVTFPMTQKYSVTGKSAHPFYSWAADQGKGGLLFSRPRWNFHKYLVAPDGSLAASLGSQVGTESAKLINAIESALPQK